MRILTASMPITPVLCLWGAIALSSDAQEVIKSGFGAGAYPVGSVYPEVRSITKAEYPRAAIDAGISGSVVLEAVVGSKGSVLDVRVVRPLEPGLDQRAIDALKQWRFAPVTLGGKPASVVLALQIEFLLTRDGDKVKGITRSVLLPEVIPPGIAEPQPGKGVTWPKPVSESKPRYTSEAMKQKIQGDVLLKIVVGVDGRVTHAVVLKSLDPEYGLDYAALQAAKQWRFSPCLSNATPVACQVTLVLSFRLH